MLPIRPELLPIQTEGQTPTSASMMTAAKIRPAAVKIGIRLPKGERFGFHNFRHSLATFLVNRVTDAKTTQGLLILLAVWDGREAAGVGGTAEIVEYAIERDRVVLWIDADHPEEPPRRILAVNFRDQTQDKAAIIRTDEFPRRLSELSRGYSQQLTHFQDQSLVPADYENEERCTREHLTAGAVKSGLPEGALNGILSILVPQFARADSLALPYHRKHARGVSGILYLAALAVTIAVGQVLFFPEHHWLIIFEVMAMLTILGLWMSAGSSGWHEKCLHARYIAEQLRIATFTRCLNLNPTRKKTIRFPSVADHNSG
jgi:hypothetical protein